MVVSFSPLAIHAKNLEASGEPISYEPAVHLLASPDVGFPLMPCPIVIDVVNAQELRFLLSTASALIPAVSHVNCMANAISTLFITEIYLVFVFF